MLAFSTTNQSMLSSQKKGKILDQRKRLSVLLTKHCSFNMEINTNTSFFLYLHKCGLNINDLWQATNQFQNYLTSCHITLPC